MAEISPSFSTSSIPSILFPEISSSSHICPVFRHRHRIATSVADLVFCFRYSGVPIRRRGGWRVNVATTPSSSRVSEPPRVTAGAGHANSNVAGVEIPVTCYQIIGVPDKAEKDQIVKSVMVLKNAEVEDGYTKEAVTSRQDLLMDIRDKLLFEPEYAGNIKEKIPPKSTLRIPWIWLPGALCLLQEVGEEKLVLEIGRAALQYPDAKPHVHDVVLSMALAECAIAKAHFEKNKVSQGFEALARAQCLLRSKTSLGKMNLLFEIEESLEGLAPACTLELLAIPQTPDNVERRLGAIAALRELLSQGLDVEASCQVQDWPCFFSQALGKLMAVEIVDLIPWDNLASTRKNKKSLDSQNQRVVIDFDCFYTALLAHIAFGFSSRQTNFISKARLISECLMVSDGVDLKLEEAFCVFLLGQGSEEDALERLREAESKKNSGSRKAIFGKQDKGEVAERNCAVLVFRYTRLFCIIDWWKGKSILLEDDSLRDRCRSKPSQVECDINTNGDLDEKMEQSPEEVLRQPTQVECNINTNEDLYENTEQSSEEMLRQPTQVECNINTNEDLDEKMERSPEEILRHCEQRKDTSCGSISIEPPPGQIDQEVLRENPEELNAGITEDSVTISDDEEEGPSVAFFKRLVLDKG